jgi:hypothetical protein
MRPGTAHLLREGIGQQIANDRSGAVAQIVRYVLAERRAVRLLDRVVRAASGTKLPDWFAVGNGVRCWLRMRATGTPGGVLACAHRANERRAVAELRASVGDVPWSDVRFDLRDAGRDAGRALRAAPRETWRHLARAAGLSRHLRREHDLFLVVRALELVFLYDRLGRLLDEGRHRVAVTSTYSNPWGIALNLAARRRGIPVVHVMHGAPLWPLPRLDYALVVANDRASLEVLARAGCRIDRGVVKSARPRHRALPVSPAGRPLTVGIFLSKEPARDRVLAWIAGLLDHAAVGHVLVRPHPANLWSGLEEALAALPPTRVTLSSGDATADLRRCDAIVAGNSSVHLEALTMGVPSVHVRALDNTPGDAFQLAGDDLLFAADAPAQLDPAALHAFYARPSWRAAFARYANLEQDEAEVAAELRDAFAGFLVGEGRDGQRAPAAHAGSAPRVTLRAG